VDDAVRGNGSGPDKIAPDVVFEVTFSPTPDGRTAPKLMVEGMSKRHLDDIRMFPGAGESPVRRLGVAWVVLEVPLDPRT
jgi:hypothetical protein